MVPRVPIPSAGARQLGIFLVAYLVYSAARWLTVGDLGVATANAHWIVDLEHTSASQIEASVQASLTGTWMMWVLNHLYLAAQLVVAPRRAGLPLPPLAADLRAPAQHDPRDLADLDPRLRGVPRRAAAARGHRHGRHDHARRRASRSTRS